MNKLAPGVFHDCLLSTNLEDNYSFSDRMVESQNELEINRSKQDGNGSSAPSPTQTFATGFLSWGETTIAIPGSRVVDHSGLILVL